MGASVHPGPRQAHAITRPQAERAVAPRAVHHAVLPLTAPTKGLYGAALRQSPKASAQRSERNVRVAATAASGNSLVTDGAWDRAEFHRLAGVDSTNIEAFATRRYGSRGTALLAHLRTLGPGMDALIVDPGLMQRLGAFTAFYRACPPTDPWAARAAFREHLGDVEVYRSMALTPRELQNVLTNGILPRAFLSEGFTANAVQHAHWENLQNIYNRHLCEEPSDHDIFTSATSTPFLAKSVASARMLAGQNVYIFTLRVAELDTLFPEPDHLFLSGRYPKDMERFCLFGAGKNEIVSHNQVFMGWAARLKEKKLCQEYDLRSAPSMAATLPPWMAKTAGQPGIFEHDLAEWVENAPSALKEQYECVADMLLRARAANEMALFLDGYVLATVPPGLHHLDSLRTVVVGDECAPESVAAAAAHLAEHGVHLQAGMWMFSYEDKAPLLRRTRDAAH